MIRYFLARGDRGGSAVIMEGLPNVTCSNPPPSVQIATLYMKTYCTACKREGFIAPKGPRRPGTAPNGKPWALSGDINICECNPPPVFHAVRNMKVTFTSEEIARMGASLSPPYSTQRESVRESDNLQEELVEQYFEIVDAQTGAPVEGMTYKLSSGGRSLVHDATLADGKTQAFSTKDYPHLVFVAWRAGEVR